MMMSKKLSTIIERVDTLNRDELSFLSSVIDAEILFRDDEEEEIEGLKSSSFYKLQSKEKEIEKWIIQT